MLSRDLDRCAGRARDLAVLGVLLLAVVALGFYARVLHRGDGPGGAAGPRLTVGFILAARVDDWAVGYENDQARHRLESSFGGAIDTLLAQRVTAAGAERVIERLSSHAARLIVSTDPQFEEAVLGVAATRTDVRFLQHLGRRLAPNVSTYTARDWEGSYVCGIVAALSLPEAATLGAIASEPRGAGAWTTSAFALGARSVRPEVKVTAMFTGVSPGADPEVGAVRALARKGVGAVYFTGGASIVAIDAARDAGLRILAHHAELSRFAGESWLAGTAVDWTAFYVGQVRANLEDRWESRHYEGGIQEGFVRISDFGPGVPEAAARAAEEARRAISAGERAVFAGPLRDQAGKVRVPAGATLDATAVRSMDWLVEGVE